MTLTFLPYDAEELAALRAGGPDAYGRPAERAVSPGPGTPCRSCLKNIDADKEMLICAARPFADVHPYAETGPVFFCAEPCTPHTDGAIPSILTTSSQYLLKAYDHNERIAYGTGQITKANEVESYALSLLERDGVAYVDVRSATNNCFLTRIIDQT